MAGKHKYKMYDLLQQIPKSTPTKTVVAELDKEGIRERTFYSDIAIKANSDRDIPAQRLLIYAKFFGVEIIELFNTDKKVKSIFERRNSGKKIKNGLS
jgi:hypothetical protein